MLLLDIKKNVDYNKRILKHVNIIKHKFQNIDFAVKKITVKHINVNTNTIFRKLLAKPINRNSQNQIFTVK